MAKKKSDYIPKPPFAIVVDIGTGKTRVDVYGQDLQQHSSYHQKSEKRDLVQVVEGHFSILRNETWNSECQFISEKITRYQNDLGPGIPVIAAATECLRQLSANGQAFCKDDFFVRLGAPLEIFSARQEVDLYAEAVWLSMLNPLGLLVHLGNGSFDFCALDAWGLTSSHASNAHGMKNPYPGNLAEMVRQFSSNLQHDHTALHVMGTAFREVCEAMPDEIKTLGAGGCFYQVSRENLVQYLVNISVPYCGSVLNAFLEIHPGISQINFHLRGMREAMAARCLATVLGYYPNPLGFSREQTQPPTFNTKVQ